MRAAQRNRLLWNLEQIERLITKMDPREPNEEPSAILGHTEIALKIVREDEAKYIGRVPPIRPSARR